MTVLKSDQHNVPVAKKHKVVIIDPFPIFRHMLYKIILERIPQVEIIVADNVDPDLQNIKTESPDVIFLDIATFPKKCTDYIQSIKGSLPETAIVILTTHDSNEHKAACLKNGADYFLSKNKTSGSRLIDIVEKTLS
jgi:DNA-binding NarL/FixJ family response regulator